MAVHSSLTHPTPAQWKFDEGGRLECKACPGLALDVAGGDTAERTPVQTFTKNDTPAQ